MSELTDRELFAFINSQVTELGKELKLASPWRAFPRWFAKMSYDHPEDMLSSDGAGDGKIDFSFRTVSGSKATSHVINSKFTEKYGQLAPVNFYDEIIAFTQLFNDSVGRGEFLDKKVKPGLHRFYEPLFKAFDKGDVKLLFLTNCKKNPGQFERVGHLDVQIIHLEDLLQYVKDDLDGAMPRTPDLTLQKINSILSPPAEDAGVSTVLAFARLIDFIEYMEADIYGLLFARNVRVYQDKTPVNVSIAETFKKNPDQFAYSNNGLTLLCEDNIFTSGNHELKLINPRVVNGAQTLHSVKSACKSGRPHGAETARVMVRIVRVPVAQTITAKNKDDRPKEVISRICIRSNQQNPIKKWDLRSNDDYQLGIFRRFRREGLFYERRINEWKHRSDELKTIGIKKGPTIKSLIAQIASFHWKAVGPARAKGHLGEIFEHDDYDFLCQKTPPELAYQIYVVFDLVSWALKSLPQQKYQNARSHIDLAVFSNICRFLSTQRAKWEEQEFTDTLNQMYANRTVWGGKWKTLIKVTADQILGAYKIEKTNAGKLKLELTLKNFARRQEVIQKLLGAPMSKAAKDATNAILT